MMWLKTCPRCHGDLALDYDLDGPFIGCIQCGAALSKRDEQALLRSFRDAWEASRDTRGTHARVGSRLDGPPRLGRRLTVEGLA